MMGWFLETFLGKIKSYPLGKRLGGVQVRITIWYEDHMTREEATSGDWSRPSASPKLIVNRHAVVGAVLFIALYGMPHATNAQEATSTEQSKQLSTLQEIVVTAPHQLLNADTSGTTNLPLPIEKV